MTPFPVDTAVVSDESGVLGTDNARVPVKKKKIKHSKFVPYAAVQKGKMRTYMKPPSPKATIPSMNTLIPRAQVPGAPTAQVSYII
jgi:hypothetical protein